jgi:hypothetical protein
MRIKMAFLPLLVLLLSWAPSYGFLDASISFVVNVNGLKDVAQSLDRLTKLVDELSDTDPNKGRLLKLLAYVKKDVNDIIKTASDTLKDTGKDITKDLLEKYLKGEEKTMKDIRAMMKESVKDARVLLGEFMAGGTSIPLQLNDVMKVRLEEAGIKLASLVAAMPLVDDAAPIEYKGTKITYRVKGYQDIEFAIKDAPKLSLKIGDTVIAQREAKVGFVAFRIPMDINLSRKFDDTEERRLGYQLVESVGKGKTKARYGGFLQLYGRFPLSYEFKEFPLDGTRAGLRRILDVGTGINTLLHDRSDFGDVATAARHGELNAVAKSRLACGGYTVEVSQGCAWELTVDFPDGKSKTLVPGKQRAGNQFGEITVTGPNRRGNVWSLLIDVEPKE